MDKETKDTKDEWFTPEGITSPVFVPDEQGTTVFDEDLGFPGVCGQPCFSVEESYEVWSPDNPGNPLPEPGNNTYVYTLTHDGGSGPFVPAVLDFTMKVDSDFVTDAGSLSGSGVEPSEVSISELFDVVTWKFENDLLDPGETTQELFVHSPLDPGNVDATMTGQASLTAYSETVGPLTVPEPATSLLMLIAVVTVAALRRVA